MRGGIIRYAPLPAVILDRYTAGESENKLSAELGMSRIPFRKRLLEAGIIPRGCLDANRLMMRGRTVEENRANAMAAQAAVRGSRRSRADLERRARGTERSCRQTTCELMLLDWLRDRGFSVTPQKAVGIYNLDLAMEEPTVAIEIFGGGWHAGGHHGRIMLPRCKEILDAHWALVIIWVDGRDHPLTIAACDYLVAFAKELRQTKAGQRQYRVILGDGQPAPIQRSKFNDPAFIQALHDRTD